MALAIFGGISLAKPITFVLPLPNPKFHPPRFFNLGCVKGPREHPLTSGPLPQINPSPLSIGSDGEVNDTKPDHEGGSDEAAAAVAAAVAAAAAAADADADAAAATTAAADAAAAAATADAAATVAAADAAAAAAAAIEQVQ